MSEIIRENSLQLKLDSLPSQPGVYAFLGAGKKTLYVGKASNLRSRVRSYFRKSNDQRAFVALLEHQAVDLETFVTKNEKEAALLENELIKNQKPRYNVKLRDDKNFLSLRLDRNQPWPRLQVVRRPAADGARYFGPYPSASSARRALSTVNRYFLLRTCTDTEFKQRTRPCLQYQIKRCPAPCVLEVSRDAYQIQVENVARFLSGDHDDLINDLEERMRTASSAEQYEQAALFRDQLQALQAIVSKQRIVSVQSIDQDVFGWYREKNIVELSVVQVRKGKIMSLRNYSLSDEATLPGEELVASFLRDHYANTSERPHEIIVSVMPEASEGLMQTLQTEQRKPKLVAPKRGQRSELLQIATANAEHAYREHFESQEAHRAELEQMAATLHLKQTPIDLECVDISHHQGEDTSAVFVHIKNGEFERNRYRSFRVRIDANSDDTAALYEVVSRRLRRSIEEPESWSAPDLLVIDGGKGQLNAALRARRDAGLELPEIVSIAKERELTGGKEVFDRIYREGQKNAIDVHKHSSLRLLAAARDEAHRTANVLREKSLRRRTLTTGLEEVPRIGKASAKRLLKTFGSLTDVLRASDQELRKAGLNTSQLASLRAAFSEEGATQDQSAPIEAEPSEQFQQAEENALQNAFN